MSDHREQQARRWTRWYPQGWRDQNEDALIETLITASNLDRRDLALTGVRLWLDVIVRALQLSRVATASLVGALAHYSLAIGLAAATTLTTRMIELDGWVISRELAAFERLGVTGWHLAWLIVFGDALFGSRTRARLSMTALAALAVSVVAVRSGLSSAPIHPATIAFCLIAVLSPALAWFDAGWARRRTSRLWIAVTIGVWWLARAAYPDVPLRLADDAWELAVLGTFGALCTVAAVAVQTAVRVVATTRRRPV